MLCQKETVAEVSPWLLIAVHETSFNSLANKPLSPDGKVLIIPLKKVNFSLTCQNVKVHSPLFPAKGSMLLENSFSFSVSSASLS